jgi:predicted helicase
MVEKLGIVYTPVEVVDFIIHSVNDVLKKEFGRSISDENIHILDPFTGTGTFITRLLQSGLIDKRRFRKKIPTRNTRQRNCTYWPITLQPLILKTLTMML